MNRKLKRIHTFCLTELVENEIVLSLCYLITYISSTFRGHIERMEKDTCSLSMTSGVELSRAESLASLGLLRHPLIINITQRSEECIA